MSLDPAKLENVRNQGGKITARCPACAEAGMDEKGEHLFICADGRFGCVVHPGDAGKPHRKRIAALAGEKSGIAHVIKVNLPLPSPNAAPVPVRQGSTVKQPASKSARDLPDLSPVYHCLLYDHPTFREPVKGELILGIYREEDGAPCPILLWVDPHVDLFWDVGLRRHVKPPRYYIQIKCQPQIDPVTGHPVIEGAVNAPDA